VLGPGISFLFSKKSHESVYQGELKHRKLCDKSMLEDLRLKSNTKLLSYSPIDCLSRQMIQNKYIIILSSCQENNKTLHI